MYVEIQAHDPQAADPAKAMPRSHRYPRRKRRLLRLLLWVPMLAAAAFVVAWSLDGEQNGRVGRNVELAGRPVGGMSPNELRTVVTETAQEYAHTQVEVQAPEGGFLTNAQALGLTLQIEPTVAATLNLERTGPIHERIWGWLQSFITPRSAPVQIAVDRKAVYRVVDSLDPGPRSEPTEPGIRAAGGRLQAVQGKAGTGIDATQVIERLPEAASDGLPIRVRVDRGAVAPRFTLQDARNLAQEGERLTASGLAVKAGNRSATVPPSDLRSWLRSQPAEDGLSLSVDQKAATAGLRKLLDKPDPAPKNAAYNVVNGAVTIEPGQPGLGCCADTAGALVEGALLRGAPQPVELPMVEIQPEVTAEELSMAGIKEEVGTFTTRHAAGQPRVANIHLMADLIRGQVIKPGETFSVNRFVGERTREKGFVVDAVIQDGKFEESVGGGISQFATTLFNAAFFAGMEFPEYQSHSLYISRYPYGREATLSYPRPDLQIRNPGPHPVLIWPTYTRSSITVSLYSTKWVDAAQTGQTVEPRGPCKLVRTERTLTYLADRTTKVDRVNALYRPAEGVNCS